MLRLIEKEIAGSGKTRLLFATNKKELQLIFACVKRSLLHFPKTIETNETYDRLRVIKNGLDKGLRSIQDRSDYK